MEKERSKDEAKGMYSKDTIENITHNNNYEYIFIQLIHLLHTSIFCLDHEKLTSYEENPQYNPLYENPQLRRRLMELADEQDLPAIIADEFHVYFICIKKGSQYYLIGPMSTCILSRVESHRFYHSYGIKDVWEKGLYHHTLMEVLQTAGLFARLLTGKEYRDHELVTANHLVKKSKEQEMPDQVRFSIKKEEEDIYRHTYLEERKILDMVREGNAKEAVRMSKEMDIEIGRLGNDELSHWRNLLTVVAALCARAAIEGGLKPRVAYRISGYYIHKGSGCKDMAQVLSYRNDVVEELAYKVNEQKTKRHTSSYTQQCKDYIQKHFKEKIYLDQMADLIGVSSSYLSRLFKKDTGMCLQDYVNEVRVERSANLLMYSDEPLSMIAEYVNFPSQSYFGKVFKARKGMTPRQFRERYKPVEFIQK